MSQLDQRALEKLIKDSGVPHRENGNSYKFTCPKCHKAEKLWMLKKTGQFICFYCAEVDGFKGRPEWALTHLLGLPVSEIKKTLYGVDDRLDAQVGMHVELSAFADDDNDFVDLPQEPLNEIIWPVGAVPIAKSKKGTDYLIGRGIPPYIQKAYDLHYWPEKQRVLFPIKVDGVLVGFQARTIVDGVQPKILTSDAPGLRARTVMFLDNVKPGQNVILCEGPIDAIKCELCADKAIPVCTMGKAVTREQIAAVMAKKPQKVYLALDPDAINEIGRIAGDLMGQTQLYLLQPPPGRKDLGECTLQEVYGEFLGAKPYVRTELHSFLRKPRFA